MIWISSIITPVWAADSPNYTVDIPCRFDGNAGQFHGGLAVVQNGGKYGVINTMGNVVIDFVYDNLYYNFPDAAKPVPGNYLIAVQNQKWGVIDNSGKPLIPCIYDSIRITGTGFAIVGKGRTVRPGPGSIDGVWGIFDLNTGQQVLPVMYANIMPINDSLTFSVFSGSKAGLVNSSGDFVAPLQYDNILSSDDGKLFTVIQANEAGVIDSTGKIVVPLGKYTYISEFKAGAALAQLPKKTGETYGKYGVINSEGQQVVPFEYGDGLVYPNGLIRMRLGSQTIITDKNGTVIFSGGKFDYICAVSGNLVFVERGGKVGAVDITGKEIVPFIYSGVREAKNGLTIVTAGDECAVINQNGKVVLPLDRYGNVNLWDDTGSILVVSAVTGRWGLKDISGRTVLPCEYWSIGPVNDNYITANNEKGYAVFNKDGDIVVPFGEFEYIGYHISESMVDVRKNGLFGYISLPGYVEQPEAWAQSEVERAVAAGLVPEDMRKDYREDITRADFCRLAINLIEIKTGMKADVFMNTRGMSERVSALITFTDTTEPVILAAGRLGIVNGVGNNRFNPTGTITRQDAAVMLQRTAKVLDFTEPPGVPKVFSDGGNFSDYAVEAIDFVSTAADKETGNSVMVGTGNDNFSPFSPYTRQQAYITVLRLFKSF